MAAKAYKTLCTVQYYRATVRSFIQTANSKENPAIFASQQCCNGLSNTSVLWNKKKNAFFMTLCYAFVLSIIQRDTTLQDTGKATT